MYKKNLLNISMIVHRSAIPPLRGGQGDVMGVRGVRGDVKKTWGMYKKHGNVQKTWECTKNLLNISMIVQRSTIPPLRGARGM